MDDVFEIPPEQRLIFGYDDGSGKKVFVDPDIILGRLACKSLELASKSIDDLIEQANPAITGKVRSSNLSESQQVESWNAMALLDEVSRQSFELVPFDKATGKGASMQHAIALLDYFHRWCEKKNQRAGEPLTSSAPAASISETSPTTATSSV